MTVSDKSQMHDGSRSLNFLELTGNHSIVELQEEVCRIAQKLSRFVGDEANSMATRRSDTASPFIEDHSINLARAARALGIGDRDQPTVTAAQVHLIIKSRRQRNNHFEAELFADPAWDIMLDLYASWLDRKRVSISNLCIAADVPATTALRWIKLLEKKGHLIREPDMHDARRIYVTLTPATRLEMHRYFASTSLVLMQS